MRKKWELSDLCQTNGWKYLTSAVYLQRRAKKIKLSSVTLVPSGLIGCASAALCWWVVGCQEINTCWNAFALHWKAKDRRTDRESLNRLPSLPLNRRKRQIFRQRPGAAKSPLSSSCTTYNMQYKAYTWLCNTANKLDGWDGYYIHDRFRLTLSDSLFYEYGNAMPLSLLELVL